MNTSPALPRTLPATSIAAHRAPAVTSGNLARAYSTRAGHLLLRQPPQYLGADRPQILEAAACLPGAALQGAGAAIHRPVSVTAKSRPHFSKINHVAHGRTLFADDGKVRRGGFA